MSDEPFYTPNRPAGAAAAAAARRGSLACPTGERRSSQLRSPGSFAPLRGLGLPDFNGAELIVSRRCETEQYARPVAEMAKGDYLRQDCVAIKKGSA
jgi:hypothetical protein